MLGWSPSDEQEFFTTAALIEAFNLARVNKSGAVFDLVKLTWMNGQYIRKYSPEELLNCIIPFISTENSDLFNQLSAAKQLAVVTAVQDNLDVVRY